MSISGAAGLVQATTHVLPQMLQKPCHFPHFSCPSPVQSPCSSQSDLSEIQVMNQALSSSQSDLFAVQTLPRAVSLQGRPCLLLRTSSLSAWSRHACRPGPVSLRQAQSLSAPGPLHVLSMRFPLLPAWEFLRKSPPDPTV